MLKNLQMSVMINSLVAIVGASDSTCPVCTFENLYDKKNPCPKRGDDPQVEARWLSEIISYPISLISSTFSVISNFFIKHFTGSIEISYFSINMIYIDILFAISILLPLSVYLYRRNKKNGNVAVISQKVANFYNFVLIKIKQYSTFVYNFASKVLKAIWSFIVGLKDLFKRDEKHTYRYRRLLVKNNLFNGKNGTN